MTGYPHDSPIHRPADHSWMLAAWVLPLVVAVGITIVTFGFAAITIAVAIMIGLVSTGLHFWGPASRPHVDHLDQDLRLCPADQAGR